MATWAAEEKNRCYQPVVHTQRNERGHKAMLSPEIEVPTCDSYDAPSNLVNGVLASRLVKILKITGSQSTQKDM